MEIETSISSSFSCVFFWGSLGIWLVGWLDEWQSCKLFLYSVYLFSHQTSRIIIFHPHSCRIPPRCVLYIVHVFGYSMYITVCIAELKCLGASRSRVGVVVRLLLVNLNKKGKNVQLNEWKEKGSAEYICQKHLCHRCFNIRFYCSVFPVCI